MRYRFINNGDTNVEFIAPIKTMSYFPSISGDMHEIDIADTTLSRAKLLFLRSVMYSGRSHSVCNYYSTIEEMSPYDTVRIFIRALDANNNPMVDSDEYLCRYDFSLKDIALLLNADNEIVVCYPPDNRMRDMKMWPPYGYYTQEEHNSLQ